MTEFDLSLIKLHTSHYYVRNDSLTKCIKYNGKVFIDKFEKVNSVLNSSIIKKHLSNQIVVAHSIINDGKLENIIIDYNGINTNMFYHKTQLLLRSEGYLNFTAYRSKTNGHLHIYIHKGHTHMSEARNLARTIEFKLAKLMPKQWRVFPSDEIPPEFNIMTLPYDIYAKERGSSWSKHM